MVLALGLAACSNDEILLGDYKLYDLGGSNQAIIGGNKGSISIPHVTALAIEGPLIFVEDNGPTFDAAGAEGYSGPKKCAYKLIDTSADTMTELVVGTRPYEHALAAIKRQHKGAVSPSCAVP